MSKEKYVYEPGPDGFYRIRKGDVISLPHHLCRTLNSSKLHRFRKHMAHTGNVVVVQHPAGMQEPNFADVLTQFADELVYRTGTKLSFIVAVNKLSEITVLDEERMEKYGWVKKKRVLMFKEDQLHASETDEEE